MHLISPKGFAIALAALAVAWVFLPDGARVPIAIVLILGALASTGAPAHTVQAFFASLK